MWTNYLNLLFCEQQKQQQQFIDILFFVIVDVQYSVYIDYTHLPHIHIHLRALISLWLVPFSLYLSLSLSLLEDYIEEFIMIITI